jgi:hypothetical protein
MTANFDRGHHIPFPGEHETAPLLDAEDRSRFG